MKAKGKTYNRNFKDTEKVRPTRNGRKFEERSQRQSVRNELRTYVNRWLLSNLTAMAVFLVQTVLKKGIW